MKNLMVFSAIITINLFAHAQQFKSLSECRKYFQTSIQTGSQNVADMDAYCKGQMPELLFCTDQALLNAMASTSIPAAQIPQYRARFEADCQSKISARAASAAGARTAGTGSGGSASTADTTWDGSGRPVPPVPPSSQNCGVVPAAEQQACNTALRNYQLQLQTYQRNLQTYERQQQEQARKQGELENQQRQQRNQANMQALTQTTAITAPILASSNGGAPGKLDSGKSGYTAYGTEQAQAGNTGATSTGGTSANNTGGSNSPQAATGGKPTTQAEFQTAEIERAGADRAMSDMTSDVSGVSPEVDKQAKALKDGTKLDGITKPDSEITKQAKAAGTRIKSEYETFLGKANTLSSPNASLAFGKTVASLRSFTSNIETMNQQRNEICVPESEWTELLCVEGKSPGMRAARALMDASGPILATIASAHKACSKTARITKYVGYGMTAANALCIGKKFMCESACGKVLISFNKDAVAKLNEIAASAKSDAMTASEYCDALASSYATSAKAPPCWADVKQKAVNVKSAIAEFKRITGLESENQVGTITGLLAVCTEKARNILSTTLQIASIALTRKSAEKCETQTATGPTDNGGKGNTAGVQEYCANAANKDSQFCKCQNNMAAEGCPGATGSSAAVNLPTDQRGVNLKPGQGGPSGFAGTNGPQARGTGNLNVNNRGQNPNASGGFSGFNNGDSGAGAAGGGSSAGMGGSGGGSGGGKAGGEPEAGAAKVAGAGGDKKWNFGSFSSLSGEGGGASKSRGGGGEGNGAATLSADQEAAIERKIASDKYSAEVTTSAGPNNFDKIKHAVRMIGDTLDPNQ